MDSRAMGEIRNDPSMEEILASIKRIIAEDGATSVPPAAPARTHAAESPAPVRPQAAEPAAPARPSAAEEASTPIMPEPDPVPHHDDEEDEVLELTEALGPAEPLAEPEPLILSNHAAASTQQAVATLSSLLSKSKQPSADQTLDGIVRELLRPMLQQWLDAHLPGVVEELVQREIKRITGQG